MKKLEESQDENEFNRMINDQKMSIKNIEVIYEEVKNK